jgi:hypothetical protein
MWYIARMTQFGALARACLAPGQRGTVLAAFSTAIYLLTEAGELFWIGTDGSAMHQRCAQIAAPLLRPPAGSPFHVEDYRLTIEPSFLCDIGHVAPWNAPRLDSNHIVEITGLPAHIAAFFSQLDLSQARGFGAFIPHLLSLTRGQSISPAADFTDPVLRFARRHVEDMARASLDRQPLHLARNADALIGLGAGLTPSGDDFLGGWLFAVKTLQAAYPGSNFGPDSILVENYQARTHVISFTLLKDLASGQAVAPLHHIINGLLTGEPLESINPFISHLTQIGHSTGWDMLTGLLTGLLITFRDTSGGAQQPFAALC